MDDQPEGSRGSIDRRRSSRISEYYQQISGIASALGLLVTVLILIFSVVVFIRPAPALEILRGLEQAISTSEPGSTVSVGCPTVEIPSAVSCQETVVTRQVEVFVVVTATPLPHTPTPQPIVEPLPTYTASVQLPYSQDFSSQLGPEWRVRKGIAIIAAGELSGPQDDEVIVEIGDSQWENYTVEFDFINLSDQGTVTVTFGQQTQYFATQNVERWSVFEGNQWVAIDTCSGCGIGRNGRLRIETSGGQYVVYIDGQIHKQLSFGQGIAGPLTIRLTRRARLDNLLVLP